ncbi:peptidoglycan recognition protein family protein [Isoptericola aurantiacus]|uniref:peptidoglycan recognition protein family protein n=1 Tax=Isoptericola aurantiacus TaxID=3377839 RepID=UPI00383A007E
MTRHISRHAAVSGSVVGLLVLSLTVPASAGAMPVPVVPADSAAAASPVDTDDAPAEPSGSDPEPVAPSLRETTFEEADAAPAPSSRRGDTSDDADRAAADPEEPELVATAAVTGFGVAGVTWQGDLDDPDGVVVEIRTTGDRATDPAWSAWEEIAVEPSPQGTIDGTEAVVVGDVAQVQARVTGPAAGTVRDLELSVVDPGTSAADDDVAVPEEYSGSGAAVSFGVPGRPAIASRAAWGADESIMTWTPRQGDVRGAAIHHTAGTNSYTRSQVPGIIRGIYAYHARTRGWGDIGYNFLVDKFGRVWEGRAGGISRQTIGGHALGFNASTTGISMLGNYETATPSNAAVSAVVNLAAWKLARHGVPASGTAVIEGTRLNRIFGHRDVASTACPGRNLYQRLGEIRRRAQARQNTTLDVPDGTFVTDPRGRLALYENGRKHIATCSMVRAYGGRCADALPVSASRWDAVPGGGRLRHTVQTPDGRLYWVDGGEKRQAFDDLALQRNDKVSTRVGMARSALDLVPYGKPVLRGGVIVIDRSSGDRSLVTVRGSHGSLGPGLRHDTPLAGIVQGELDRRSIARIRHVPSTTGVIRRANGREFVLALDRLVRIDGTGHVRPTAVTQDWGKGLMKQLPRTIRAEDDTVFVRERGHDQRYLIKDGVLHPVTRYRARVLNGGSHPTVHEILKVTKRQFPTGSRL